MNADLLYNLESNTYINNGTSIVNIDGPRGFTLTASTAKTYTNSRTVEWDSINYDNTDFNISDPTTKALIIGPKPYQRKISMLINFLSGGVPTVQLTNFVMFFNLPLEAGGSTTDYSLKMQHSQNSGYSRSLTNIDGVIPANAYLNTVIIGSSSSITTSLVSVTINGIISA